jgi:hypothetical protein
LPPSLHLPPFFPQDPAQPTAFFSIKNATSKLATPPTLTAFPPNKTAVAGAIATALSATPNKTTLTTPIKWTATLTGANNVPGAGGSPVVTDSPTRGVLHVDISTKARAGVWTLAVAEATQVVMSHIHLGSASTNGAPVLALAPQFPAGQDHTLTSLAQLPTFNPTVNVSLSVWKGTFTAADFINLGAPPPTWDEFVVALTGGNLYGNVHTVALPNGAIRGQLAPAL